LDFAVIRLAVIMAISSFDSCRWGLRAIPEQMLTAQPNDIR
jgi:hypothetical protein